LKKLTYLFSIAAILSSLKTYSQVPITQAQSQATANTAVVDSARQKDVIDIIQKILDEKTSPDKRKLPPKTNFSVIPYAGYTLSTGVSANINGNVSFFTSPAHTENLSIVAADLSYDSKSQKILLTRSEIWLKENTFKVVSDLRFERYPTDTYGLGSSTTFATDNKLDYNYLRIYETLLKKISTNYYAGIGYNLDYHYGITATGNADGSVSDYMKYGQTASSTSSGINFDLLYDDRKSAFNPLNGTFASAIFRQNLSALGSNVNWQSLQFDFRKYFKLSPNSNDVLAFWTIAAFTSGNVPYLDLPSTGGDMYNNSGRGYAVGRFRGRDELYLEGEYRFGLTRNGLLGGVLFVNGESFTGLQNNTFQKIAPAAGPGIRIKINKHSNTNVCIDYGIGTGGSHGFFVNLGEVF
jgi:outer membrane protein assembly factor BamA